MNAPPKEPPGRCGSPDPDEPDPPKLCPFCRAPLARSFACTLCGGNAYNGAAQEPDTTVIPIIPPEELIA